MSKNTVKAGLTPKPAPRRKRSKRVVENAEYAAFARRILRAYARRIADGDIEALRHLVLLPSGVDTALRAAVVGLREFGYSWADIAERLGVSKQAAQMRYGTTATDRGALDRRMVDAGQGVRLSTLVAVFADHCRGIPAAMLCPGCGHRFPDDDTTGDCPTNQVVRPLLRRRRSENMRALTPLTPAQMAELEAKPHTTPPAARATGRPALTDSLFDTDSYVRKAGLR